VSTLHGRPEVGDLPDLVRPLLLTEAETSSLRSLLEGIHLLDGSFATDAKVLLDAINSREVEGPHYAYVLAGPWGNITEGDGSLEATIAGCRDARRQHWGQGQGRDDRYHQIQVERYATYYVTDATSDFGDDLGEYRTAGVVVPVEDEPLTPEQQAESEDRVAARYAGQRALYAHLNQVLPKSAQTQPDAERPTDLIRAALAAQNRGASNDES
jgi:hypothetical protein